MPIVDRREAQSSESGSSRHKFLKRYKNKIAEKVRKDALKRDVGDFTGKVKVKVRSYNTDEPTFQHDNEVGHHTVTHPGNKGLARGTKIPIYDQQGNPRGHQGDGEDEFSFIELDEAEWREMLFAGMELPDFVKKSLTHDTHFKWHRAGFTKQGIPSRLDIEQTFFNSVARRMAMLEAGEKEEDLTFIEEVDVRYRHFVKIPDPIRRAVMFCVMDVSASMSENDKYIAKVFFVLLHLFLSGNYEAVDLIFIRHTEEAKECDQEEFFYSKESGGTHVLPALQLVDSIIKERYDLSKTNIYVSQVSDGDCFDEDGPESAAFISEVLLPQVQYFAYVEIIHSYWRSKRDTLADCYQKYSDHDDKFNIADVEHAKDVFQVLQKLFTPSEE